MATGDLGRRLAVAAVGIPVGALLVWQGGWWLGAVLVLVAGLSAREFYGMAEERGGRPFVLVGTGTAALLVALATGVPVAGRFYAGAFVLALILLLGTLAATVWRRGAAGAPMAAAADTMAGALYTGGTLAFAPLIRHIPHLPAQEPGGASFPGAALLIFPLVATWVGDSCAYFAGRRWGRRKLIPSVSPGKTVVGGIAGLAGAVASAAAFAAFAVRPTFAAAPPVWVFAVMGLLIGAAAQVGDLAESVLKREAGVKDSGNLLPGHGGALDRFDAVFFTLPLTWALYVAAGMVP